MNALFYIIANNCKHFITLYIKEKENKAKLCLDIVIKKKVQSFIEMRGFAYYIIVIY
jgi:hypothetical protein